MYKKDFIKVVRKHVNKATTEDPDKSGYLVSGKEDLCEASEDLVSEREDLFAEGTAYAEDPYKGWPKLIIIMFYISKHTEYKKKRYTAYALIRA